jgi:NAD(P)-dependent dehydrogenase (short-subunit alcohol dehydrogenase family)
MFADEGCQVVAADLDPSACADLPRARVVAADLGTADGVRLVVDAVAESGVDVLVNNLAVAPGPPGLPAEATTDQ